MPTVNEVSAKDEKALVKNIGNLMVRIFEELEIMCLVEESAHPLNRYVVTPSSDDLSLN